MQLGEFIAQLVQVRAQYGDEIDVVLPGGIGHPQVEVLPEYIDGLDRPPVKVVVISSEMGHVTSRTGAGR